MTRSSENQVAARSTKLGLEVRDREYVACYREFGTFGELLEGAKAALSAYPGFSLRTRGLTVEQMEQVHSLY